jgi:Asp-tRNA(Asn)/Glu-tRNA(Gln) amidotransferase C subunit
MVQVSIQAFLDEVATWELTLQRESKKLKQLKKISKNIFQINSIDITTVEIESELIQYKKIKDKVVLSSPRSIKIALV